MPTLLPDSEIKSKIRSFKTKQREIFEVINKLGRDYVKHSSCLLNKTVSPLNLFGTGSWSSGKSHLIKTDYNSLLKTLTAKNSDKPRVLHLAPSGVATANIEGMTIYLGLGIPIGYQWMHVPILSDKMCSQLRIIVFFGYLSS